MAVDAIFSHNVRKTTQKGSASKNTSFYKESHLLANMFTDTENVNIHKKYRNIIKYYQNFEYSLYIKN